MNDIREKKTSVRLYSRLVYLTERSTADNVFKTFRM